MHHPAAALAGKLGRLQMQLRRPAPPPPQAALFPPLQQQVRDKGLWACHLGPELGGPGMGQFKLACMNLILGRSKCASKIFGTVRSLPGSSARLARTDTLACVQAR